MAKKKAVWTLMVYLAGDNNLSTECLFALTEMKKAAPGEYINVLAQFDPRDDVLPTHRYLINSKTDSSLFEDMIDKAQFDPKTGEVHFERESKNAIALAESRARTRQKMDKAIGGAKDLGTLPFEDEPISDDTDTGSPVTLYNFLSFCIQEYPAEHYIVVLSGHAGGTESDYLLKDESSRRSLTFNEMKQVFQQLRKDLNGQPIDIVGMDNCLMSMGEICYEFRDLAQIVVGSESYSPASGWPYRQVIERLRNDFTKPEPNKSEIQVEAAKAIVEEYVNYYSSYWVAGMSVTQSALDVRKVGKLREYVDRLAMALEKELKKDLRGKPLFKDELVLAHWEAQSYNGEWFVDLFDFCDCLQLRSSSDEVGKQCQKVKEFLAKEFVLRSCYSGAAFQYSYGVSIYFPWSQVSSRYQNLGFVKDSKGRGWLSFLETYTDVTRRRPRGFDLLLQATAAGELQGDSRMAEMRMAEMRMAEMRMAEMRMAEMRMAEMRMAEMRMSDWRMGEMRMAEMRMAEMRMMAAEGKNPIHSMRNPPVVFFPTRCIAEHKEVMNGVREFFARPASPKANKKRKATRLR